MKPPGFRLLLHTFILRGIRRNRLRTGLTVTGIMLGVAILLAIQLANHTALDRFRDSLDRVSGRTNVEILPVSVPDLDESLMSDLRWIWDAHGQFSPVLEQAVTPATGERQVIRVLGLDTVAVGSWLASERDTRPETQTPETGKPEAADFLALFRPGHALVGQSLATSRGLTPGDDFAVLVNNRAETLRVAGVLGDEGLGGAYDGNLLVMDIGPAQALFDMVGRVNRIDIRVPEPVVEKTLARLGQRLPATVMAQRPARRGEQVEKMLRSFQYNLMAVSFIALLVAMFLIYNTMSVSIIRRRPEIGTLRALGVSRATVFQLFALEALFQGAVGTLLGLGAGILLAQVTVRGVSATVETLYTGQAVAGVVLSPAPLLQAAALGIGLTLLAALPPVYEAASVPPAEATRRSGLELKARRFAGRLLFAGAGCWALALLAARQPPVGDFPVFGHMASFLAVLGMAFAMPALLQGAFTLLLPVFRHFFGTAGILSVQGLQGALGRTSVAVASLMIAIAMTVSLAVMIGSFRQTVILWVHQTVKSDFWLEPLWRNVARTQRLDASLPGKIRRIPGVEAVDRFLEFPIEYAGRPANLAVGDFDVLARYGSLLMSDGEPLAKVYARMEADRAAGKNPVLVTEPFAYRHRVRRGDKLSLPAPRGMLNAEVAGVYYDYSSEQGYIVMPRTVYARYYEEDAPTGVAIYLAPGANTAEVRRAISALLPAGAKVNLVTNRELRAEVLRIFDETFAITYALHAISITVAMLGVMNALFTLVLESRRDFGILKYLGASHRQIRRIVLLQAGILGLLGNATGLAAGLVLSLLLIHVINRQSFGWTIQFALPVDFLVQTVVLIMLTALVAGLLPARLAARTPAPEVVRLE